MGVCCSKPPELAEDQQQVLPERDPQLQQSGKVPVRADSVTSGKSSPIRLKAGVTERTPSFKVQSSLSPALSLERSQQLFWLPEDTWKAAYRPAGGALL